MNIAPISEPKTMIPAQAATQKIRRLGDLEVVQRRAGPPLAQHEGRRRGEGDDAEADRQRPLARHRRQVDPQHQRRDQEDREDAAEVVDRLGALVDVGGDVAPGEEEGERRQRQGDEEDRAPVELLQQGAGEQRSERGDRAADRRPERDRAGAVVAGPQRRDQCQRGREGHAGGDAAEHAGDEEDPVGGGEAGQQRGRDREPHAEQQHHLAPVAVAESAQVEDRGRQAQRVADRDQVERRLAGAEGLADVGQGDVGDRQVEVRDRGDQDQRGEDETGALGAARLHSAATYPSAPPAC